MFDTSNLQEVSYCIYDMNYGIPRGTLIGWVPPSVKVLRLDTYHCRCIVPETIEELYIDRCDTDIVLDAANNFKPLPNSIKRMTLEHKFDGIIREWPKHLEKLTIHGWDCENEVYPITNLPEGLQEMHISWGVPIEVKRWPSTLTKLTIETSDDDMVTSWFNIEHAPIPVGIEYTHVHFPSIHQNTDEDYDEYN